MNKSDLLIELGIEEIPVDCIDIATKYLKDSFEKLLGSAGLSHEHLYLSSTPRRLILICRALDTQQADRSIHKTGPAKSICFGSEGSPSPALLGFLKKNQAKLEDIVTEQNERGEFVALDQTIPGEKTADLVSSWITQNISQIPFPKKMFWNQTRQGFIRPLRWILALWEDRILPLELFGVKSGNISYGNRYLGLDKAIRIESIAEYFELLESISIIPDRDKRRDMVLSAIQQVLTHEPDLEVVEDSRLVEIVTDLVEFPTAVLAEFEEAYLQLPEKIIISTISQNQKYFSVCHKQRNDKRDLTESFLANKFVFISNGDPESSGIIRLGNEKVVKARLADALWYYKEDTSKTLECFVPKLDSVVFQSSLGTMKAKADRLEEICSYLAEKLGFDRASSQQALRAAKLCKADLVTTMLGEKEFTKLQGYIGKHYALVSGEEPIVAEAIYEHYMPRGERDSLPATKVGAVLAIADKIDTICGIFSVGLIPTGSGDPFALRRAANGIYNIIVSRNWSLNLEELVDFCLTLLERDAGIDLGARDQILAFLKQRLSSFQKTSSLDYDVVEAVLQLENFDYVDLLKRAQAIQAIREQDSFIKLVIGFKRVSNIIASQTYFSVRDDSLLCEEAEVSLAKGLDSLKQVLDALLSQQDYPGAIEKLVSFGSLIASFFDHVLVNAEDEALRNNRYALLYQIRLEFLRLADISLLVIEQGKSS